MVVPLNPRHQQPAQALDAVGAGLVHGLPGGDILADLLVCQGPEGHLGLLHLGEDLVPPADRDPGANLVGAPGQGGQHGAGLLLPFGLSQDFPVPDHHGVRPDDQGLRVHLPGDPAGLLPGENLHQVPGIPALERGFVNLRRLCGKFQSHLPQQLTAAGGLGR